MSTYGVVLFLHIASAIFGFSVAGVAHTTLFRTRRAANLTEVRSLLGILDKVGPLFGAGALGLLVFGAWLIQLSPSSDKFHWSDGWIITATVTLVVVEAVGGIVIGRGVKAMIAALPGGEGPVDTATRARLADGPVWLASHATTAAILSVVMLMTNKPSGATAVVVVVIGVLVGIASAIPFTKPAATA